MLEQNLSDTDTQKQAPSKPSAAFSLARLAWALRFAEANR